MSEAVRSVIAPVATTESRSWQAIFPGGNSDTFLGFSYLANQADPG
jgi:hypothetical protein